MRVVWKVFSTKVLFLIFLSVCLFSQEVRINEIMFDPMGSEFYDEFIELYNKGADSVSLRGFSLFIRNSSGGFIDSLVSPDSTYVLPPRSYCLIPDRGYLVEGQSDRYDRLIPDTVLLLTTVDNSFGDSGLKNTEPNEIFLLNKDGDTVSYAITSPDQVPGYSDEKIDSDGPDVLSNWGNSKALDGTPGFRNSVTPSDYDLAIVSVLIDSSLSTFEEGEVTFFVTVKNEGKKHCEGAQILCGLDADKDSLISSNEVFFDTTIALSAGEECNFRFQISDARQGENQLVCKIICELDEVPDNNDYFLRFYVPFRMGSIVFNEIMYNPLEIQGGEWIEFYNTTGDTIDIKGWKIKKKEKYRLITSRKCLILPHSYFVVSNDASIKDRWGFDAVFLVPEEVIPALNNNGDSLSIVDASGMEIDFVRYTGDPAAKGLSLERLNPFCCSTSSMNWKPTINEKGGTPGEVNSQFIKYNDLKICELRTTPLSHLSKGDTIEVFYRISNCGIEPADYFLVDISVYSRQDGSPIYQLKKFYYDTLRFSEQLTDSVSIPVLEYGTQKLELRIDYDKDEDTLNNVSSAIINAGYPPKSVLINEVMYYPDVGNPEWIELYNPDSVPVNLENFRLKDASGKVSLILARPFFVFPDSFVVITSDKKNLLQKYKLDSNIVIQVEKFPGLNNTEDSVVITDAAGYIQDSLFYTKYFGYRQGVSIERISPLAATNDISNWDLSQDSNGATPGRKNSIAKPDFDLSLDTVLVESEGKYFFEDKAGRISVVIKNVGLLANTLSSVCIQIENPLYGVLYSQRMNVGDTLNPEEERIYTFVIDSLPGGLHTIFSYIESARDERRLNDSLNVNFGVSYSEGSVVINEIMYDPESGESEWIEIYNRSGRTIDFTEWYLRDANGEWSAITTEPTALDSGEFLIVAADKDFLVSFPDFNGKIIFPERFPVLNNSSDSLFLADVNFNIVDRVYYEKGYGGGDGVSLERRDPDISGLLVDNWGSSASEDGATPGSKNSILRYEYDVGIESFSFKDTFSAIGKENTFVVKLKNTGRKPTFPLTLEISFDGNFDGVHSDKDVIWKLGNIPPLMPDSTLRIEGKIFTTGKGYCEYRATVRMDEDRDLENNTLTTHVISEIAPQEITINEFLANPGDDQCEFIELVNMSSSPINLRGISISGALRKVTFSRDFVVFPDDYYVVAQDSSFFDFFLVPLKKVLVPDKWLILNNISGKIVLLSPSKDVIDSLVYTEDWNVVHGKSLEKALPGLPSYYKESWDICRDEKGATPGCHNSITPYQFDISIDSVLTTDTLKGGRYSVKLFVSNKGLNECKHAEILINSEGNVGKDMSSYVIGVDNLVPGKSEVYDVEISGLQSGINRFCAFVNWEEDLNKGNDTLFFEIVVPFPKGCLLLSEFMAAPQSDMDYQTEFIELYNASSEKICMSDWYLSDSDKDKKVKLNTDRCILPDSFIVIAGDSTILNYPGLDTGKVIIIDKFPSLNNVEDEILLYDVSMQVIDSLRYDKEWGVESGKSMERVSFKNANTVFNWKVSRSQYGCTPGNENSVALKIEMADYGIKIYPNPFTPDGDGVNDAAGIHFKLPFSEAIMDVAIYDLVGRLIYIPAKNLPVSSEGTVYWDGSSRYTDKARVGMYIVRVNVRQPSTGKSTVYISTVILAGKL